MSQQSAQGSITIKRLRSGDNLYLRFTTNGVPLFQAVSKESGSVVPDWDITHTGTTPPEITPVISTLRGDAATFAPGSIKWKYNYTDIVFETTDANNDGWLDGDLATWSGTKRFKLKADGTLKIAGNLASASNYAADYLTFSATAVVAGVEYSVEKVIDINIQPAGGSSYVGTLTATTEQISTQTPTTDITARLYQGTGNGFADVDPYHVKWYKDNQYDSTTTNATKGSPAILNVDRDDVDGTQLFIAEFFAGSDTSCSDCLYRQAIRITDISDEYYVGIGITSQNKEVGASGVDIEASLYKVDKANNTTSKVTTITGAWRLDIMRKGGQAGWTKYRSKPTSGTQSGTSITDTITTADTDWTETSTGLTHQDDVEVLAEVTF